MGFFPRKLNHDFLIAGGLEVTGNTTLSGTATITGTLTQTGVATFAAAPVFSAGVASMGEVTAQKSPITLSTGGYIAEHVESLTGAVCYTTKRAGTALLGYGVSKLALTLAQASDCVDFAVKLSDPLKAGVRKTILVSWATGTVTSTYQVSIRTDTSTKTFYGTTANAATFTTDAFKTATARALELIGITTDQWAVITLESTNLVLSATKIANT